MVSVSNACLVSGSPAHAGIDPAAGGSGCSMRGLPRSRGDRPSRSDRAPSLAPAPPLPRGSTPRCSGRDTGRNGSPAHAGIDPPSSSPIRALVGLPRSRGDRPDTRCRMSSITSAPPLTRGSTRHKVPNVVHHVGSPAHAGIDRPQAARHPAHDGLPRSRGDRPSLRPRTNRSSVAPPLTRGSTVLRRVALAR